MNPHTPTPGPHYATGGRIPPRPAGTDSVPFFIRPSEEITDPERAEALGLSVDASRMRRKKSRLPLILALTGAVAVLLVLAVIIAVAVAASSPKPPAGSAASPLGAAPAADPFGEDAAREPTPTAAGPTLTAADMTLSLKTMDKECFGSAGCNLVVEVRAKRNPGVPDPSPDETWAVTYEIRGVEDSPTIGTFTITGKRYEINEEYLSTKSSASKPTVKITSVEKVGE